MHATNPLLYFKAKAMRRTEVTSSDDTISLSDLSNYIDELESARETLSDDLDEAKEALEEAQIVAGIAEGFSSLEEAVEEAQTALDEWDTESAPLAALKKFHSDLENYGDYAISENYWYEYARYEIDEAIAALNVNSWLISHIDYDSAAEALQSDLTGIEFGGVTFYVS